MASPIKVQILGDAKGLTTALGQAQAQLKAFGLASNKGKLLAAGAATAVAGLGIAAIKMAVDMDQAKRDFELSTGLVGDAANEAFGQVTAAAGRVPDSIERVIEVGGNLITTMGDLGDRADDVTEQFLDLNRLGFGELTENQVGEFFKTWGLSALEMEGAMDILAQTSQATGVDIGMLTDLATSNAGALDMMGLSYEDSIMFLGQWEKAGIDTNKVVRGLNSNIDMLTAQGKDTSQMLEDMTKVMDDGNISAEEATLLYDLFGAEATDIMKQLEQGTISLSDFGAEMGLSGQSVQEMTDASATVGEKFSELRNKIMIKLAPALVALGDALIKTVDFIIDDLIPAIATFSREAVQFFQDVLDKVQPILDGIRDYFQGVVDAIMGAWETFSALFRGDFKGFWKGLKKFFGGILKAMKAILKVQFEAMKLYVKEVLGRIFSIVGRQMDRVKNAFVNKITAAKDAVVDKVKELPGDVREAISDMIQAVRDKGTAVFNAFKALGRRMLDGLKEALSSAVGFAGDVAKGIGNAIIGFINSNIIDRINNGIPDKIEIPFAPDINLPDNPLPRIPTLQHGGSFSGGMALVGEMGPELLRVPFGGSVKSTRDAFGSSSGVGGNQITVNVNGHTESPEQIAAAVLWKLRRS